MAEISQYVKIAEKTYKITSDDDYLAHMGEIFEPDICKLFLALVECNHTVLDVGANIGCTSILFGQIAKDVISFEPSPSTFNYLNVNVKNSNLENVKIHNVGLGHEDKNMTLTFAPSNRAGGFVSNQTQASAGHTVESIRIKNGDSFVGGKEVNFIKIDVEGFEMNVLRGLTNTINKHHPIVVAELNHWCLNAFQRTSIPEFFDYLLSVFPIIYAIDGDKYLNLHDANERYAVMYHHILHFKYPNLVCAFNKGQVNKLLLQFSK